MREANEQHAAERKRWHRYVNHYRARLAATQEACRVLAAELRSTERLLELQERLSEQDQAALKVAERALVLRYTSDEVAAE